MQLIRLILEVLSQRFFPSGNFLRVFSQVPISQLFNLTSCIFPSLSQSQRLPPSLFQLQLYGQQSILALALGPNYRLLHFRRPNLTLALGPHYRLLNLSKPNITLALGPHYRLLHLTRPNLTFGMLPLGNLHIWEAPLWKLSLDESPSEKCLWKTPKNNTSAVSVS